ncbi:MAG TPA: thiamine diphosphokinase, partial [Ignavibacteriaceae bacterium]|nr:thiamine diphosphokinase [Ignavibacteriaceae bacterium]
MKKFILLANGKPPRKKIISFLQSKGYSSLVCADGGANKAKALNLVPDFIIGDLDSIYPHTLKYFQNKSKIIKLSRQNDTDVEKCLKEMMKRDFRESVLLGVTGNRLDHTFCNLGIVIKFFRQIKLKIIAENSLLIPYAGNVELKTIPGEIISLYGFDTKTKIKSEGLFYPLKNVSLPFGKKESTSNIAESNKVILNIKGGIIFVIRDLPLLMK